MSARNQSFRVVLPAFVPYPPRAVLRPLELWAACVVVAVLIGVGVWGLV